MNTKNYYIKDEAISNLDDDKFNYKDISININRIIDNNKPPYNIAIIGKWGLGKSSLIEMVLSKYKNDTNFIIQEINAWKYEKEAIRKVFLKQLWQGIRKEKIRTFQVIKKEINDIINDEIDPNKKINKKERYFELLKWTAIQILVSVVAFAVYKIVQWNVLDRTFILSEFLGDVFLNYCRNLGKAFYLPVLVSVAVMAISEYREKKSKKIEMSFSIETTDDYEIFLEEKIGEKLEKNKNLKIITVIDDLDRLSVEKIVETLDALKAFVGFKNCIFIVPFDDEIIKEALTKKKIPELSNLGDIVESELILDKLFQFKFYLPPILKFDIKKYASNLVKEAVPDFINEFCDYVTFSYIIDKILIYPGVTTPRQVKKLITHL